MKLVFAMLADYALGLPDGKVIIQGGDIDRLYTSAFPTIHPTLALVVKLAAEAKDRDKHDLRLVIAGAKPDGEEWFRLESPPFSWREPDERGRPAKYSFVTNLPLLVIPTEGEYLIRVLFEGKELASLPLWAELLSTEEIDSESETSGKGEADR
jgi:hypothetical protein